MPNDSSAGSASAGQFTGSPPPEKETGRPADPAAARRDWRSDWSWRRFTRNAFIIAGVSFLTVLFIVKGVVPHLVPKNFGVVTEGRLYRSGELTTTALKSVVEAHGIRTIIDLGAHDHDPAGERREQATADLLGVRRVVLYLEGDATGDPNRYVEALRIIADESNGPVLIHCAAGAQRTGCAVALYRSIAEGWDDERALVEAEDYRHDPLDNPLMRETFHEWKDEIARSLETGDAIEYTEPTAGDGG